MSEKRKTLFLCLENSLVEWLLCSRVPHRQVSNIRQQSPISTQIREIDEKFAKDKIAIDRHERQLMAHAKQLKKAKTGLNALGQCVYVLFMRSNGGTVPEQMIESANESMTGYLFNKEGEEEDDD